MRLRREWRDRIPSEYEEAFVELNPQEPEDAKAIPPEEEEHPHIEDAEIVIPPEGAEDQFQAHGGDDCAQDVPDAPERDYSEGASDDSSESLETSSTSQEEAREQAEVEANLNASADVASDHHESSDDPKSQESSDHEIPSGSAESDDSSDDSDGIKQDDLEHSYQRNRRQEFSLELLRERRLQNAVATIISKVAEDLSGWPIPGDDEWDIREIMLRRISRRPLTHCRQSRERESVVLMLDTSGSCWSQAQFFSRICSAAARLGAVEIYSAPNAYAEERYVAGQWQSVSEKDDPLLGKKRTIIFFGDFDGGWRIVEASLLNRIYWFSCEDRYSDLNEHSWNGEYSLRDFRGRYFTCLDHYDFLRLIKKVR